MTAVHRDSFEGVPSFNSLQRMDRSLQLLDSHAFASQEVYLPEAAWRPEAILSFPRERYTGERVQG